MNKYKVVRNHERSDATVEAMKDEKLAKKITSWERTKKRGIENWKRKPVKIKPFSEKRMKENGVYKKVREQFLEANPECQVKMSPHCSYHSQDIHHKQRRRTEDQRMNTEYWLASCRACHLYAHAHEDKARELGIIENGLT